MQVAGELGLLGIFGRGGLHRVLDGVAAVVHAVPGLVWMPWPCRGHGVPGLGWWPWKVLEEVTVLLGQQVWVGWSRCVASNCGLCRSSPPAVAFSIWQWVLEI